MEAMISDEQLVEAYRNGDETAFEELFERYRRRMFHFCLRLLQNRESAEEVFQEVFLRIHTKLHGYRSKERFAQWLFTVANHACVDELRKRKRMRWLLFSNEPHERLDESDLEADLSRSRLREEIVRKLQGLDIQQRQVFLLRIDGDLMFREIAELLKVPLNTVLGRYHQAVLALKASVKGERS